MKQSMKEFTDFGRERIAKKTIEKQVNHLVNTLNEYNLNPEEVHLFEMIFHKLALSRKVYTLEDDFVISYNEISSLAENYEKVYNDYSKTRAFKGLCSILNKFDTTPTNKKQIALLVKDVLAEKGSDATIDIFELFKNYDKYSY